MTDKKRSIDSSEVSVTVRSDLLLGVLLGGAAIAVDVTTPYTGRAPLQNGADGLALSIAQDCASSERNTGQPIKAAGPLIPGSPLAGRPQRTHCPPHQLAVVGCAAVSWCQRRDQKQDHHE